MKLVDYQNYAWVLFEYQGKYLLDANCNHSAFNYTYMIELSPEELASYEKNGRDYLSSLAQEIHYSAPIAKGSRSAFKGRDVSKKYFEASKMAIKVWKKESA